MTRIYVLLGMSASGKDTILNKVVQKRRGLHKIVSHTTRPQRIGEKEGEDYFFVSKREFERMIKNGEMLEYKKRPASKNSGEKFYYYGIAKSSFKKDRENIVVLDTTGLQLVRKQFSAPKQVFAFFVHAPEKIRRVRAEHREKERFDPQAWEEREEHDREQFMRNMNRIDYILSNEGRLDKAVKEIVERIVENKTSNRAVNNNYHTQNKPHFSAK